MSLVVLTQFQKWFDVVWNICLRKLGCTTIFLVNLQREDLDDAHCKSNL